MTRVVVAAAVFCWGLQACSKDTPMDAVQACNDYRDAWADRAVDDCKQVETRQEIYDVIDAGFAQAGGANGCADAAKINDEEAFKDACLPGLRALECDKLAAGDLPAACQDQILYGQVGAGLAVALVGLCRSAPKPRVDRRPTGPLTSEGRSAPQRKPRSPCAVSP